MEHDCVLRIDGAAVLVGEVAFFDRESDQHSGSLSWGAARAIPMQGAEFYTPNRGADHE
jgi:hypothetical protein